MFDIYDLDDFFDFLRKIILPLVLFVGVCLGGIFMAFKIAISFRDSYVELEAVRVDINGKTYYSSDLVEFDGDYYYKNADGELVKIEFYEDDFK